MLPVKLNLNGPERVFSSYVCTRFAGSHTARLSDFHCQCNWDKATPVLLLLPSFTAALLFFRFAGSTSLVPLLFAPRIATLILAEHKLHMRHFNSRVATRCLQVCCSLHSYVRVPPYSRWGSSNPGWRKAGKTNTSYPVRGTKRNDGGPWRNFSFVGGDNIFPSKKTKTKLY